MTYGVPGPKGDTGARGPTGAVGATGPQGPAGTGGLLGYCDQIYGNGNKDCDLYFVNQVRLYFWLIHE